MIPVYICEDQEMTREYLEKQVKNIIMIENLDMYIKLSTGNPEKIIEEVVKTKERGIYLLDIDLSHIMSGFDLAKVIRERDARGFVVFVTTHGELALNTFKYQIEAMDYILKDEPDKIAERLQTCFLNIHQRMESDHTKYADYFILRQMDEVRYIRMEDIIYFETSAQKHKVNLVTEKEYIEFFGDLKSIEEKTGEGFIRSHRSYLINRNYIDAIYAKESYVLMKDGKRCGLSRSGRKRIEEQLKES
ncbi:MAG: response regulator transcription factor [Lachnospiraceae bacterium]|nr:response regulator transcription factor [Lachnospiraceae bacterium]